MTKRALIVVTSHGELGDTGRKTGWYLSEVTHVYYPLIKAGFTVDFASPEGGAAPLDEGSRDLNDATNKKFLEDKELVARIQTTTPLSKIDPKNYELVHFAGGHGAMWDFPDNKDVQRIATGIYEQGGIVAAVCHGGAALVNVKLPNGKYLVDGKPVTSFTNNEEIAVGVDGIVPFALESKLKERGAVFQEAQNWADNIVVAGRLITGQNPQSGASLGKKLAEVSKTLKPAVQPTAKPQRNRTSPSP